MKYKKLLIAFLPVSVAPLALGVQEQGGATQAPSATQVQPDGGAAASFWWSDFDGDGLEDALAIAKTGEVHLLANQGDGSLQDVTSSSGLDRLPASKAAAWADFDGDGWRDLFVASSDGGHLFQNLGGKSFQEVPETGISASTDVRRATWLDFDQDGMWDLHLTGDAGERLFHNLGSGAFESVELHLPSPAEPGVAPDGGAPDRDGELGGGPGEGLGGGTALESGTATPGGAVEATRFNPRTISRPIGGKFNAKGDLSGIERPVVEEPPLCADSLVDASALGTCLTASSEPTLGTLYPLSEDLFVSPDGQVGLGTTLPEARLDVLAPAGFGGDLLRATSDFAEFRVDGSGRVHAEDLQLWDLDPNEDAVLSMHSPAGRTALISMSTGGPTGFSISSDDRVTKGLNITRRNNQFGGDTALFIDRLTGRVGLGTTEPLAALDIQAETTTSDLLRASTPDGEVFSVDGIGGVAIGGGATATAQLSVRAAEGTVLLGANRDRAVFSVVQSGRVNIVAAGEDILRASSVANGLVFRVLESGRVDIANPSGGDLLRANNGAEQVFTVTETGRVVTTAVEITGGGDLVEGFEASDEACEPGTVVVIDAENPGKVMLSSKPYDTCVAGVVSGANGVNHGLRMGQDDVLDGDTLVAMTGRVYVRCSTENGAIRPGDLLTTASLDGHAMKATDKERRSGAMIGKAMGSLDEETGLVLVLVNLQ